MSATKKKPDLAAFKDAALMNIGDAFQAIKALTEKDGLEQEEALFAIRAIAEKGERLHLALTEPSFQPGGAEFDPGEVRS